MTSNRTLTPLVEGGNYFECPRWHEDRWWVADFYRHAVFSYDADGGERLELEVEAQPSGLGWLPDGDLLAVSMKDRRVLRRGANGSVATHADLSELTTGHVNDMIVDRRGSAFVGNFGFDLMGGGEPAPASLVRIDPDGAASVVAEDLWFPNGMVITDDGTLIVAETFAARLAAFDIQPDGTLGNRRVWAQVQPSPEPDDTETMLSAVTFAPDGCALDADGHVWAANALGAAVCRIAPGGEIVDEVAMPDGLGVFACGLGGEDGRTLIACAAPDFYEHARMAAREAVLLTTTVEVPHGGLP
ncbi:MAG TPA: SMP-30/gluconolactonase/LRE family protein [Solirubrobacteraceae bacterium]|nr:SMP-30/gluconolactonase/LRE family protein [Solirubrobacteraceae bacterium]